MKKPDWSKVVTILTREGRKAIKDFAHHFGDEPVSYFGFDANPYYGKVLISFDTLGSSLETCKRMNERSLKKMRADAREKEQWTSTDVHWLTASQAVRVSDEFGDFSGIGFSELDFPEWQAYVDAQSASKRPRSERADTPEQYLTAQVTRAMFVALDTLVRGKAFDKLTLAERCGIGFVTHDSVPVTTHVLNWPEG